MWVEGIRQRKPSGVSPRLDVDDFSQYGVGNMPVTISVVDGDGGCFGIQPYGDSDALAWVLVGEANCVTDEEFFTLRSRRRCRFDVRLSTRRFGHDRSTEHAPTASSYVVLNDGLCLTKFDHGVLCRRPKRVVADIVDGHPQMQALTYFENTSGVIKHFADSKLEARGDRAWR